jgi:hypothetical protein
LNLIWIALKSFDAESLAEINRPQYLKKKIWKCFDKKGFNFVEGEVREWLEEELKAG